MSGKKIRNRIKRERKYGNLKVAKKKKTWKSKFKRKGEIKLEKKKISSGKKKIWGRKIVGERS